MKKATQKVFETLGWILALLIFPVIGLIFWIWRMCYLKKRCPEIRRGYLWWPFGIMTAFWSPVIILLGWFLIAIATDPDGAGFVPRIIQIDESTEYGSAEGLYRLTGVRFPEVEMVEAYNYNDGGLPSRWWNTHKFAIRQSDAKALQMRLDRACVEDSVHWSALDEESYQRWEESRVSRNPLDENRTDNVYWYFIYPDSTSVDRSRGMCDRMVEGNDGTLTKDWDGTFVSVEVQNDTVWIREGWLR